jgi:hypothetical protein
MLIDQEGPLTSTVTVDVASGIFGSLLKLRCHFATMEPELNRSVSEKMSMRAEMPFLKVNGKSEISSVIGHSSDCDHVSRR